MVYRATVQNYSHFPEYEEAYRRWRRDPSDSWRFIDEGDEPQRWLHRSLGAPSPISVRHPQFSPTALSNLVRTLHRCRSDCTVQGKLQLRTQALLITTSYFWGLQCRVRVHAGPGHNVAAAARQFHRPTRVHRNLENATSHGSNSGFSL